MDNVPPVLIMLVAAAVVPLLPSTVRSWAFLVAPALVLVQLVFWIDHESTMTVDLAGFTVILLEVDELNEVWATIFAIVALTGGLFALHLRDRGQQSAALAYGASAFGVLFAGDLLTLIVFWELMAVASFFLIMSGGRTRSKAAAQRYLFVHVVGGSVLLGGILWHAGETGGFAIAELDSGPAAWLALVGVLVNAAMFPLHAWLSDAYPESSPTGMVFLGAFTTKTAVYVLVRLFPGWEILVVAGAFTALYAAVYALMQNDIRRLIAYHIIGQVGFMVAAVGVGGHAALEIVADQAFTHVLWQALMVMGAGAVLYAAGTSKLTELGGLARPLRAVMLLYLAGAVSIAVVPLLHGLGAEALYTVDATGVDHRWTTLILTIASAATVLAVAIRLPYHAFFGPSRAAALNRVPFGMYIGMAALAFLSIWTSLAPEALFDVLGFDIHAETFHANSVVFGLQAVLFSAVGGWLLLPLLRMRDATVLDTDWFYRKAVAPVRILVQEPLEAVFTFFERLVSRVVDRLVVLATAPATGLTGLLRLTGYGRRNGPEAALAFLGRPPIGLALAAVLFTIAAVLLIGADD